MKHLETLAAVPVQPQLTPENLNHGSGGARSTRSQTHIFTAYLNHSMSIDGSDVYGHTQLGEHLVKVTATIMKVHGHQFVRYLDYVERQI